MNNDLISRAWLKEHKFTTQVCNGVEIEDVDVVAVATIDNAPPVERPKGVWIVKQEKAGAFVGDRAVYSYTCPFCKVKEFKKYPFCHCGADMRGGRE